MLSKSQRTAVLELNHQGLPTREIARLLKLSRQTVRRVLRSGSQDPPPNQRAAKADEWRPRILELHASCKGNLVRVHEELVKEGAALSYQALTAYCRRQRIGHREPVPAGRYEFAPGEELQHDTSPHDVIIGGVKRRVQTASAVLAYSRMLYFQCCPAFTRFDCKVFLTGALRWFQGIPSRVMIDNTHVVVLRGSGRSMTPVPEMASFAERMGFEFVAHEIGDANRSARVERPFWFIETNFLAGRTFTGWEDLNQRAREWCDKVNGTYKKHLRAVPRELYGAERAKLKPLPAWIPEPYRFHERVVDTGGYVTVNTNRYSVPADWMGRRVEVRETKDKIEIQAGARSVVTHGREPEPRGEWITLDAHRRKRGEAAPRPDRHSEEKSILAAEPGLAAYVDALKKHGRKIRALLLRQLLRMVREYPRAPLMAAVEEASRYGLYDLDRVERMVLRRLEREYFLLQGELDDDE